MPARPPPGIGHTELRSNRFASTPQAGWPDGAVARGVRAALADELGTRAAGILSVDVSQGVVRLGGTTATLLAKQAAEQAAKSVRGTRAVVNELQVRPPTVPDATIAADIRHAWDVLPCGEEGHLRVEVHDGIVTLRGVAGSRQQERWASRAAAGVRGVVAVHDDILVSPPPARSDSDILRDVRGRLRWALPLDGSDIAVDVKHGDVALSGKVARPADLDRAEVLANVMGVRAVDVSKLAVEPAAFPSEPRAPTVAFSSDDALAQAVRDALFYDPRLDSYDVAVSVHDAVATLTGQVPSLLAARAAGEDAQGTVGIAKVVDRVGVRAVPGANDALLARRIREALAHDSLGLGDVGVRVTRGVARLSGPVAGQLAHLRALEVASSVPGVQGLRDDLKVAARQAPPTAEARRQSRGTSARLQRR